MSAFTNLIELAEASVSRYSERPLFGERRDRTWDWTTYGAWNQRVNEVRAQLAALGVGRGDRVAIISRNSAAWAVAAYATYGLGAAFVPMYEAQRPSDWELILRDSGASVVFCRTPAITAAVEAMLPQLPALRNVITIESTADDPRALAAHLPAPPVPAHRPSPDEVATLIYTSGTTGIPKGVMLTHGNLASNAHAAISTFPISEADRTLSFLPWAHIYGQLIELHILVGVGASTAFNTDTTHLLEDLKDVKPTILVAVPRIFNKLRNSVCAKIEKKPAAVKKLFWRGLNATIRRHHGEHLDAGDRAATWLAHFLFKKIRGTLGGRMRYAISGSATLSREVAEFINALGIEVYEGYGLTETSPIISFNRPGHRKFGSVGLPIEGVSIELDRSRGDTPGEGEIIIHGPNVMKGYHARPEENARTFTADGGLRTGDLGRLDEDGYVFITGRIKEQYKLENGKYVMPSPLEERLQLSPFITNAMLYGSGRPHNVALISFDAAQVRTWASEHDIPLGAELTQDDRVRALIREEIEDKAKDFRGFERPRDFVLTEMPFTVENGLLTPTLKIKRREVIARFGAALDGLYAPTQAAATATPPPSPEPTAPGAHR